MHPDKIPKLLYELIKNSRRSDRDLAKVLGFSPDFTKLGFELVAFTFTQWTPEEKTKAASPYKWLEKDPRVIFVTEGNGLNGKNSLVVTMHKNYTDYSDFVAELQRKAKICSVNSFIATLTGVKKHLNFANLQKV